MTLAAQFHWCYSKTHFSIFVQPLNPSDAKPDMANLRLIKESEIRRGNIIGSGAFGTVYKVVFYLLVQYLLVEYFNQYDNFISL